MTGITPTELHSIFANLGVIAQLRSDGKIVFLDKTIEGFKDSDGEEGVFFIASIPFPDFVYINAPSIFKGQELVDDPRVLKQIIDFSSLSVVGSYELDTDGSKVSWSAGIYHNGNLNTLHTNIKGVISNLLISIKTIFKNCTEDSDESFDLENLRQSLETNLNSDIQIDCHPEETLDNSIEVDEKQRSTDYKIKISENLSAESRALVDERIDEVHMYLEKNNFSLPDGYILRVQHGNDEKNVETGFNKGPYICIVDSSGKEKKSMKLFLSRRGNLNSFIALSTVLKRS